MKARNKNIYNAVQMTTELRDEPNQKTVRPFFKDITSVEIKSSGILVSTRASRFDIPIDSWIMQDQRGKVAIVTDVFFRMNYEAV